MPGLAQTDAKPGSITLSKKDYDFLLAGSHDLSDSNKRLKEDSIGLAREYQTLLNNRKKDSLSFDPQLNQLDQRLNNRNAMLTNTKQTLTLVNDSLKNMQAAVNILKGKFSQRSTDENNLTDSLTNEIAGRKESISKLNNKIQELASAKAETGRIQKEVLKEYVREVNTLTQGASFSVYRVNYLQQRGRQLRTYLPNSPQINTAGTQLDSYEQLSKSLQNSDTLLNNPFNPPSCKAGIDLLAKAPTLTQEQNMVVQNRRTILANYCKLNWECDSVVKSVVQYNQDDPTEMPRRLSLQLEKVNKTNYPFLYAEMKRLIASATKGATFKDSRISHSGCQ